VASARAWWGSSTCRLSTKSHSHAAPRSTSDADARYVAGNRERVRGGGRERRHHRDQTAFQAVRLTSESAVLTNPDDRAAPNPSGQRHAWLSLGGRADVVPPRSRSRPTWRIWKSLKPVGGGRDVDELAGETRDGLRASDLVTSAGCLAGPRRAIECRRLGIAVTYDVGRVALAPDGGGSLVAETGCSWGGATALIFSSRLNPLRTWPPACASALV